ncbi:hypothetical protein KQX54_016022 [Cotesia glomerata]|uniref:Uncharacterized protein n=1 Tax=Cotesia glomerata TaxID=32391 RepID=A0AAV7IQN4_COTGL|nr:hypothetical protein KQX54_016022 [Cotesia glomerata]
MTRIYRMSVERERVESNLFSQARTRSGDGGIRKGDASHDTDLRRFFISYFVHVGEPVRQAWMGDKTFNCIPTIVYRLASSVARVLSPTHPS